MPVWDPEQYVRFAGHRDRPFHDLVARVGAAAGEVAEVADLGCGPGTLTATLAARWPGARVTGVDSSPEMVGRAQTLAADGLQFVHADLRDWVARARPTAYDVIVSNATLQWVPDHLGLLPALVERLRHGGWLAVQIPGNHEAPLHAILRELARREPYSEHAASVSDRFSLPGPGEYLQALTPLGCRVDAWETTYYQVLSGPDPVFEWISGTGARPVLQALPEDLRARFAEEYRARLREAYPAEQLDDGEPVTLLPFRRVFAVAQRGGTSTVGGP
jgi:trans-aconitate 2-methyltransferase